MSDEKYAYCPDRENAHYGVGRLGSKISLLDYFDKLPPAPTNDTFNRARWPIIGFLTGFFGIAGLHMFHKQAPFYRIHNHFLFGTMFTIGTLGARYLHDKHQTRQEAIYRHYIETHPEDFPPFGENFNRSSIDKPNAFEQLTNTLSIFFFIFYLERKKLKDLVIRWRAVR